jgi:hypothetical protein
VSEYPHADNELRNKLRAVVEHCAATAKALADARKGWETYTGIVPNSDHWLVPASLFDECATLSKDLTALKTLIETYPITDRG